MGCTLSTRRNDQNNKIGLETQTRFSNINNMNTNLDNLNVETIICHAFSSDVGGRIELVSNQTITTDWKQDNKTALINLSNDRMTAENVSVGKYNITCQSAISNEIKYIEVEIIDIKIPKIKRYTTSDASSDLSKDGTIEVEIENIYDKNNIQFLWTTGVITEEPKLYDVLPGVYCVNLISKDKVPILFYHTCSPATVGIS